MSRKDVELVIRAKDEATKAVNAITAAINSLTASQDDMTKGAGRSDTALARLGQTFSQLDKQLRGATVGDKIARSLDSANKAVERLGGMIEKTNGDLSDLQKRSNDASQSQLRLEAAARESAAALDREAAALTKAKDAAAAQNVVFKQAVRDREQLVSAEARLTAKIDEQRARLDAATLKLRERQAAVDAAEKPNKKLQASFEAASRAVVSHQQRLDELIVEQGTVRAAISQTSAAVDRYAQRSQDSERAVLAQATALDNAGRAHRATAQAVREGEKEQRSLARAIDDTKESLTAQNAALDRAQTEQLQLAAAAGRAEAAVLELAGAQRQTMLPVFGQVRNATKQAEAEWKQAEARVRSLAAEMPRLTQPTKEQAQAWNAATTAARTAKAEYILQRDALHQIRAVLRTTATDTDGLRARQDALARVLRDTGTALAELRDDAGRSVAEFNRMSEASDRARRGVAGVRSEVNRLNARPVITIREALGSIYGPSRQAMSITQRWRGEVLSLISAYGGFYGVISLLSQTVTAFQTLEAATSRLNVVMEGDMGRTEQELDFLRRTADRLGISFGDLAQEYSKFAVATQGTVLEGENTRRIFVSVAEAARVNKISMDQMRGVFTALTQIVSKGAVQMEELRQQLGDRLPGAIQIMADGLGVSTAELIRMMEAGEVTSSALVKFAQELDRRFGSQLANALRTTSAEMGRFQNAVFQTLIAFGEGGFIESFTELLRDMTATLQSAQFQSFVAKLSEVFAGLIDVVGLLIRNFDMVVIALTALVGIKVAPFFAALAVSMVNLVGGMGLVRTAIAAVIVSFRTMAASAGVSAGAITRLSFALRALLSTTGIGLLITAISVGIGLWVTRTEDATEALVAHRALVDQVRNAYEAAGNSVDGWRRRLEEMSVTSARENLDRQRQLLQTIIDEFRSSIPRDIFGNALDVGGGYVREVDSLFESFRAGEISAQDFRRRLDELAEEYRDLFPVNAQLAASFDEIAQRLVSQAASTQEANDILLVLTGTEAEASAAMARLTRRTTESGDAADRAAQQLTDYVAAVNALKEAIPELSAEMERLNRVSAIEAAYQAAIQNARSIGQVNEAYALRERALAALDAERWDGAVRALSSFTDSVEAAAALLRQEEGFIPTPEWDVNALRLGYGTDTVTLADGSVQQVVEGMRVTVDDANRDLYRRIETEFMPRARSQVGAEQFGALNAQQQAVLTSIAYNYGSLPQSIVDAVRTGSAETVADAIRALDSNPERRQREAAIYESPDNRIAQERAYTAERERQAELDRRRAEDIARFHEDQAAAIAQQQFENSLSQEDIVTREVALAIRRAELEAQSRGTELTEEQRRLIAETTAERYRQQGIDEREQQNRERATEAEQAVNDLLSRRSSLLEQLGMAQERGEVERVAELRTEIDGVNSSILSVIDSAIAMWEAVGGSAAAAAIERLRAARMEAQGFSAAARENLIDWRRVGDLIASGVANAFDKFAQAVAEGTSVGEAARNAFLQFAADFLRQIAQMIIQQTILNMLRSWMPGLFGTGHTGGLVGSSRIGGGNTTRRVDPGLFSGAMRYHSGGVVGLRPGEVPAILERNEEVLTQDDPRHILNGGLGRAAAESGAGAGNGGDTKIVNMFDAASFLSEALNTRVGERVLLNWVRANPAAFKSALGGT